MMSDDVPQPREYLMRYLWSQKIKIPSFKMRFLKRGFRFWWLRTMSTEEPVAFSKNSLASIKRNGFGVSVSTNKSMSLPSFCSPLAVDPKRDKDVMPYLSLSMFIYLFSRAIHSSFVISEIFYRCKIKKIIWTLQKIERESAKISAQRRFGALFAPTLLWRFGPFRRWCWSRVRGITEKIIKEIEEK